MRRLLVFNPDTDYALALDRAYYTPPAHVAKLRRELALLPALYASPGDALLLLDTPGAPLEALPHFDTAATKGLEIVGKEDVKRNRAKFAAYRPDPWGWNRCIRQVFLDLAGDMPGLPDEAAVDRIRELSHRRTTIRFFEEFSDLVADEIESPVEIFDPETGLRHWREDRNLYFKAPWSSSGRGILLADDREEMHVRPWLQGMIQRQGSVLMEKAYRRRLDFATEWFAENGTARFTGYSVFNTSRRGKYHSNRSGSQAELLQTILDAAPGWGEEWLLRQKAAIEKLIAPGYEGPLGIDMLATESGDIDPCVEINLRHTMGEL